jgi:CRISPR system Cascade subunit CasC
VKLHPNVGIRTRDIGIVFQHAVGHAKHGDQWAAKLEAGEAEALAETYKQAEPVAKVFGNLDKKNAEQKKLRTQQAFLFTMEELGRLDALAQEVAESGKPPSDEEAQNLIGGNHSAVDVALFGRMLASGNKLVRDEAAAQVAHAFTVDAVEIEDDYFTAVDDLNLGADDAGSGSAFLDAARFGSGLYYLYACIDTQELAHNLSGSDDSSGLAAATAEALVRAMVQVTPSGKRNPYAHHTYAHYALLECGNQQPRSLAVAFQKAVTGGDVLETAVKRLKKVRDNMDEVYGACADDHVEAEPLEGVGSFDELFAFARKCAESAAHGDQNREGA